MKKDRFKLIVATYIFLIKRNQLLLTRRFQTGYEDGKYGLISGHLDGNETVSVCAIREAKEEAGITIKPNDLVLAHIMHRKAEDERIDFFFVASKWQGKLRIVEQDKCDAMGWFGFNSLPENMVPYVRSALECYRKGKMYSEFGWQNSRG